MEITNINLAITTKCNRACPDCCMNIPYIKGKNMYEQELKKVARIFHGIDTITITGGEPTMNPKFVEWVPKLKEMFGCKNLDLETNGNAFETLPFEIWKHFDNIFVSNYGDNLKQEFLDKLKTQVKNLFVFDLIGNHIDRETRLEGSCFRGDFMKVLYCEGKLYRCSAGFGAPDAIGIELTENWMEEIVKVPLNCQNCLFAGSDK